MAENCKGHTEHHGFSGGQQTSAGGPTPTEQGTNYRAGSWQTRAERKAEVLKGSWETGDHSSGWTSTFLTKWGENCPPQWGQKNEMCHESENKTKARHPGGLPGKVVLLPWLSSRVRARVGKRCERTSYLCRMNLNTGTGKVTAEHTGREINRPNSEENSKRWKRNESQVVPINPCKKGALSQGDLFSECQQTAQSPRTRRDPDRQLFPSQAASLEEQTWQCGRSPAGWKPFVDYGPWGELNPQPLQSCPSWLGPGGGGSHRGLQDPRYSPLPTLPHTPLQKS